MFLNLGMGTPGNLRRATFAPAYGAEPSTTTTSRKAYPKNIATGAAITVSAGAQYSLDGGAWTSTAGVWGTSKYIQIRGPSNANYGLAVIHTVTIGVLELDFTIWTKEASSLFMYDELEMTDNLEMV